MCGVKRSEEAHHIFSRRNFSTRYAVQNGLGLCQDCHDDIHDMTRDQKETVVLDIIGDLYYFLQQESKQIVKKANIPFKEIIRELKWRLEQ